MVNSSCVELMGRYRVPMVWCLRVLLGVVFITSGLAKGIDIFGTVFKLEEYAIVWDIMVPRTVLVVFAMLLAGYELVFGFLLAVGAYKRVSVWMLLLMMVFMLPLTLYIWIANPVSDCGCFGDYIRLSNGATFAKNIVITLAVLPLLKYNRGVAGLFIPGLQWTVVAVLSLYILAVELYGINIQPLVDFRSFAAGTAILPPEDEEADDEEITFVYAKDGHEQEFAIDYLPDSTWTFVGRNIAGEDSRRSDVTELNIYDVDGNNVTREVVATEGEQIIVVIPQYERASIAGSYAINELQRYVEARDGSAIELIGIDAADLDEWQDLSMASLPIYIGEPTMLKELSRGDMSVVYLKDGIVQWKRTLPTIDVADIAAGKVSLDDYRTDGGLLLLWWSVFGMALLGIICFMGMGVRFFQRSQR